MGYLRLFVLFSLVALLSACSPTYVAIYADEPNSPQVAQLKDQLRAAGLKTFSGQGFASQDGLPASPYQAIILLPSKGYINSERLSQMVIDAGFDDPVVLFGRYNNHSYHKNNLGIYLCTKTCS